MDSIKRPDEYARRILSRFPDTARRQLVASLRAPPARARDSLYARDFCEKKRALAAAKRRGKTARRANQQTLSSPSGKNIPLNASGKSPLQARPVPPGKGRIASCHERAVGCDGRDSVGRAMGSQGGCPVSDRPARGRTTLPTAFARTRRTARGPARPLAQAVADGEVVWSWRPGAGVKSCGDASGPTGLEMHRQSGRRRWQTSRSPRRARSKP